MSKSSPFIFERKNMKLISTIPEITAPALDTKVLTLDEAKRHLAILSNDANTEAFVNDLIKSVHDMIEGDIGYQLMSHTAVFWLRTAPEESLSINYAPTTAISVEYHNDQNTLTAWPADKIETTIGGSKKMACLINFLDQPDDIRELESKSGDKQIKITLSVGFANDGAIPAPLKNAARLAIAQLHENRSNIASGNWQRPYEMPLGYRNMVERWCRSMILSQ